MRLLECDRQWKRRDFLRFGTAGISAFLGAALVGCDAQTHGQNGGTPTGGNPPPPGGLANLGALQTPDGNGLMLPPGFTSRVVARSGQKPVISKDYIWHGAPDGGAVYAAPGGGWIYVSNSELPTGTGGVGALKFDAAGNVIDAYPILAGTSKNCAGGRGLAGQWYSCEENGDHGIVYECDPTGVSAAIARPALGHFNHEAVAFDVPTGVIYMTEDRTDGGFYRYLPNPNLVTGTLQVAQVLGGQPEGPVTWLNVPDPLFSGATPTRYQVARTAFNGGEGIVCRNKVVYFATKGDNRIWAYDINASSVAMLYDFATSSSPVLSGVDNIEITADGELVVAEDGGDMQLVAVMPSGQAVAIAQVIGQNASEITGPAFTPDRSRLYFSSQRGTTGASSGGITYEISGPFAD